MSVITIAPGFLFSGSGYKTVEAMVIRDGKLIVPNQADWNAVVQIIDKEKDEGCLSRLVGYPVKSLSTGLMF